MKHRLITIAIAAAALAAGPAAESAQSRAPDAGSSQPLKDGYLKSKIVGALAVNPHVSASKLDVKVENGIAYLGGTAKDATERDLAVEIAKGVDGVKAVRSSVGLQTAAAGTKRASAKGDTRRTAGETVDDATLTARVKGKLIRNSNTPAGKIDVDTRQGVVTLTGTVDDEARKDLAGKIAENTEHVVAVHNELTVAHP